MMVLPGSLQGASYTHAVIEAREKNKINRVAGKRGFPIWEGCEVSCFFRQGCRKRGGRSSISGRQWAAWGSNWRPHARNRQVANFCNGLLHCKIAGCFLT